MHSTVPRIMCEHRFNICIQSLCFVPHGRALLVLKLDQFDYFKLYLNRCIPWVILLP